MSSPALVPNTPLQNEYGSGVNVVQTSGSLIYAITALSGLTVPIIVWIGAEMKRMMRNEKLKPLADQVIDAWRRDTPLNALLGEVNMKGTNARFLQQLDKIRRIEADNNRLISNGNLNNSFNKYKAQLKKQIANKQKAINNGERSGINRTRLNRMRAELHGLENIDPNTASGLWNTQRALRAQWTETSRNSAFNPYKSTGFLQFLANEASNRQEGIQRSLRSYYTATIHCLISILALLRLLFVISENSEMLMSVNESVVADMGKRITNILQVIALATPTMSRLGVEQIVKSLEARTGTGLTQRGREVARFTAAGGISALISKTSNPVGQTMMKALISADKTYREIYTFTGTSVGSALVSALQGAPFVGGSVRMGARTFRNALEGLSDTLYTLTIVVQGLMLTTAAVEFYRARGYKEQEGVLMNQAAALPSANNNGNFNNTGIARRTRSATRANRNQARAANQGILALPAGNNQGRRNNSIPLALAAPRSPNSNNNSNNNR
jgi:hypothetical protein